MIANREVRLLQEVIPKDHPRYESLMIREKLVKGFREGIVVPHGLIAHGRGEALDYILGEKTTIPAHKATKAAAALLLLSEKPVISVNGNTAALVGEHIIELSRISGARIEVNLFHRSKEREEKIKKLLESLGAEEVLTPEDEVELSGISSERRFVNKQGIAIADTVLVGIEDGDRAEWLVKKGKNVIAIDLNPFSRTSTKATITIVDNITRALPNLVKLCKELKNTDKESMKKIIDEFDNIRNLKESIKIIMERLDKASSLEYWGI